MAKHKWLISDVFCIDDILRKVKKKRKRLRREKKVVQKDGIET